MYGEGGGGGCSIARPGAALPARGGLLPLLAGLLALCAWRRARRA
jgi:hypothetical protein